MAAEKYKRALAKQTADAAATAAAADRRRIAFERHLSEYANIRIAGRAVERCIRGKIIVIELNDESRSDARISHRIAVSSELCAMSPDEVGTVVIFREESKSVGHYLYSGELHREGQWPPPPSADRIVYRLTFVDKVTGEQLDEKKFYGGVPPGEIRLEDRRTGSEPDGREIAEYIWQLPRKPASRVEHVDPTHDSARTIEKDSKEGEG